MTVLNIWQKGWRLIRKHPVVFAPFLISGACSVIVLYILFLAPHRPISYLLAPPIRMAMGEKFLHYPFNFVVLPKLFRLGDLCVSAFVGMLMSAVTVGMVADILAERRPSFLISFLVAIKRYFMLILVWFVSFGIISLVMNFLPGFFDLQARLGKSLFVTISLAVSIFVQLLFIYVVPALILGRKKIIPAFKDNLKTLANKFIPSMIVVAVPAVMYVPILLFKSYAGLFAQTNFPEMVLLVLLAGVVMTLAIDFWITVCITILYVKQNDR